ncbi:hypothetical protein CJ255_21080 [Candidatus Viridilinea mediisalina]|uniref:Blue (type 1) copper domain-containing protein n=1 Tax=Candidatus Viridilinea mediisalina TaxID=2024553 RepID=A0A2A6RDP9_9CHLR|nr:hypothetical protein CJ255_21080 [Candidatus Viridilinea mediisalina]
MVEPTAEPEVVEPTAEPEVVEPTAEPEPEPTPTEAAAAPAGRPGIPSEPFGPALATGTGTPIQIGTDPGAQLLFDVDRVTVPNGPVTLTFTNDSDTVQHNWVLIEGDDPAMLARINQTAQDQQRQLRNTLGSVPPSGTDGVLVATQILNMGESVTFTFDPPGPGTYTFICTFPEHFEGGMVGTLVVES